MSWTSRAKESNFYWETERNREFLIVEHAMIIWKNFTGKPTTFNPKGGKRTFNLVLTEEMAQDLMDRGWNVKAKEPRDEDDDILYTTEIVVNMDGRFPPRVCLCSDRNGRKLSRRLTAETIGLLDSLRAENVDIRINQHFHDVGKYQVKGYADAIMFTKAETNLFGGKYDDYEDDTPDDELPW